MKKVIIFFSIFFLSPLPILAQVYIVEVMPNTTDDANLEYIDIQNTGCTSIDISGYEIADKEKSYTFAAGSTLGRHERYRLGRPTSKIILNNSNEELSLRDSGGTLMHNFSYATSVKGVAITVPGIILDECEVIYPDEDTGTEEEDNNWEGDTTEDATTQEDILEEVEAENTTTETDDEIDDTVEDDSTDLLDENGEDIIIEGENIQIEEEASETVLESTDTGSSDSAEKQTQGDEDTEDIQTSNLLGKSGSLAPQILLYSDSDEDGYIDMLEILYDIYITGSVDTSEILIYSNTGGLYENRVNTASGYILDAEIEDNILRLFIEPSYYQKKSKLIINATTQSDLRLRTNGFFGVTSLSGVSVGGFLLTTSFDSYREVYEKGVYESLGMEDISQEDESTSGATIITFPDIIPTIQNYTNTTFSGGVFICRETPCRLNLNFESIFNTTYSVGSYTCRVTYNGIIENKCNPSQWNPMGAGGFEVRIVHKATGQYRTQYFPIEWNIIQLNTSQSLRSNSPDYAAPVPRITLNGKLTKKQIQKDDNHIYCYTNTCSVNFDGSSTYDPDGSSMTYSWSVSGKIFSTKKNPTTQEFSTGEHMIELIVTDSSGKSAQEYYRVSVFGDMTLPPDTEIAIAGDASNKKSKKRQAMSFFSPPELVVEKSSDGFSKKGYGYRCVTTSASCSVNFALTGITTGVYYQFSYAHEHEPFWSTNPRSKSFKAGKYILVLSAHYEKGMESIWQQSIPIEIMRVKKAKTVKTSTKKVSQEKAASSKNINMIPTAYADDGTPAGNESTVTLSILFLSILLNVFFLRRKIHKIV